MSETITPLGRTTGASEWLVFFTNLTSGAIRGRALQDLRPNESLSILSWLPNGESFRLTPDTVFFYDRTGIRLLRSEPRLLSPILKEIDHG